MITKEEILRDFANTIIETNNYCLSRRIAFLNILKGYREEIDDIEFLEKMIKETSRSIQSVKVQTNITKNINQILKEYDNA